MKRKPYAYTVVFKSDFDSEGTPPELVEITAVACTIDAALRKARRAFRTQPVASPRRSFGVKYVNRQAEVVL